MPDARSRRLTPHVAAMLGSAGVLVVALSGCAGTPAPTPAPPASASAAPIFASDEEALAAAEAAYESYRAESARISSEGGRDPERVVPYVSDRYASIVVAEFVALEESGLHMEGSTAIDSLRLAEWSSQDHMASVSIYLCRDVSGARVVNSAGADVTPADRQDRIPLVAFLISSTTRPDSLVVDGVEQWSGDNFC